MPAWFLRHYPVNRCLFMCVKTPSFYCIAAISFTIPSAVCGDAGENLTHKKSPESCSEIVYALINFEFACLWSCEPLVEVLWLSGLDLYEWFSPACWIASVAQLIWASPGIQVLWVGIPPEVAKFSLKQWLFWASCVLLLCLSVVLCDLALSSHGALVVDTFIHLLW